MEKLGEILRKRRLEAGMTLREVEKKTSISNAYLSQLENHKITQPSPAILKKLADVYDASYNRLMEVAGYPLENESGTVYFKTSKGLEDISKDEEKELLDYLRFMRRRRTSK